MIAIINTTSKMYSESDFDRDNIKVVNTTTLELHHCVGCFGCWTKTPGECFQKDDMPLIAETVMNSNLTVFISDVKVGFISSELKKVNDKMIQLIHPYMDIVEGEVHHKRRYKRYPKLALVLIDSDGLNDEVFEIIDNIYKRVSINFRTKHVFTMKDTDDLRGLNNEINNY